MISRKQKKEQSMLHIGEIALDLFYEKGFSNTKVSDIAAAAEVSVGLISYYFGSKEQLFESIIGMTNKTLEAIKASLAMAGEPLAVIEAAGRELLMGIGTNQRGAKLFTLIYDVNYNPQADQNIRKLVPEFSIVDDETKKIIARGQQNGTIRAGEPAILSRLFWSSFSLVIGEMIDNEELEVPKIDWFMHILTN